ncbi:PIN domain-containing protein [Luteolibacter arcticus]|uniref:Ribonuclease VapC n=1 Tax=Luteolibacter arcticus TaxID=1581411 RepID=A0ABT3GFJ5_9BACT|nr:TA system VapC family ribonuclease toxin [Luteolibacter arcticus]MCW1922391.1 PIN domain-containing protein [Luteolibacter arcticus]
MIALLDISVLIARADPGHQFHARAGAWLRRQKQLEIASCPLTENGFLRIYGHPSYPGGPGSPEGAAKDLAILRNRSDHRFLPDSVSLLDRSISLSGSGVSQLTDLYLLALAVHHSAQFVTLDHRIPAQLVQGGKSSLIVIPR